MARERSAARPAPSRQQPSQSSTYAVKPAQAQAPPLTGQCSTTLPNQDNWYVCSNGSLLSCRCCCWFCCWSYHWCRFNWYNLRSKEAPAQQQQYSMRMQPVLCNNTKVHFVCSRSFNLMFRRKQW